LLGRTLVSPFVRWLSIGSSALPVSLTLLTWLGWSLLAAALVAAVVMLVRHARGLQGRRAVAPAVAPVATEPRPEAEPAEHWRRELELRLAGGDLAGALAALWWWLARKVSGAEVDPSWTGGELVRHSRRPELLPAVRRLDTLTYGGREVRPEEVRELLDRLEGELS
ncbi:MAG: DUF4129 domain-containing protein, partial [Acidobacteria bacterium]|nr:DUF4129 domain-containing protein [Acidobacteriota bacterium]